MLSTLRAGPCRCTLSSNLTALCTAPATLLPALARSRPWTVGERDDARSFFPPPSVAEAAGTTSASSLRTTLRRRRGRPHHRPKRHAFGHRAFHEFLRYLQLGAEARGGFALLEVMLGRVRLDLQRVEYTPSSAHKLLTLTTPLSVLP